MPIQVGSLACPCRYSSAVRPTDAALTRNGMSLLTSVTSRPSAASPSATDRIRVSLESLRKPCGSTPGIGVVQLDLQRAAGVVRRHRLIEPAVLDPQLVEHPQRLAGEPAELGMVALVLQLGDHHERHDHLVVGEPGEGRRVGQQDRGVQDEHPSRWGGLRIGVPIPGAGGPAPFGGTTAGRGGRVVRSPGVSTARSHRPAPAGVHPFPPAIRHCPAPVTDTGSGCRPRGALVAGPGRPADPGRPRVMAMNASCRSPVAVVRVLTTGRPVDLPRRTCGCVDPRWDPGRVR